MPRKKTVKRVAQKGAKKKNATARAAGKTQISISLPASLVDKIDVLAAAENRNRSNFIATALENIAVKD